MSTAIVCGVDGSPDSTAAVGVATSLAETLGARLVLAHVVEPAYVPYARAAPFGGLSMAGPLAVHEERVAREEAGARLLEQVADAAGVVEADHRVAVGAPAERLADIADDERADLLVVGSRGRGPLKAAFLGSVSKSLVGLARCPVLIVPPEAARSRVGRTPPAVAARR
jgi:nucleotide-binding universal stress UspA family protein